MALRWLVCYAIDAGHSTELDQLIYHTPKYAKEVCTIQVEQKSVAHDRACLAAAYALIKKYMSRSA